MPTDPPASSPPSNSVLFLFAHQDDEFGVLHQIEQEVKSGTSVYCLYTTSGVVPDADPQQRNAESRNVLESLGVDPKQVFFQHQLDISDGETLEHITSLRRLLETWAKHKLLRAIYVPAWEGGHPDHDVLHAVTVQVWQNFFLKTTIWQYPLYNSNGLAWGFFKLLTPLAKNGEVLRQSIPWPARWRHLRLCLNYRSQAKSWLGLYPFVLWHYLFKGWQSLQPANLARIQERPHQGQLYYEFRGFSDWQKVYTLLRQEL
jgi:LmbE family N-acetylglucosaminyl deacetylase